MRTALIIIGKPEKETIIEVTVGKSHDKENGDFVRLN
jgi:hypothetical protein